MKYGTEISMGILTLLIAAGAYPIVVPIDPVMTGRYNIAVFLLTIAVVVGTYLFKNREEVL